MADNPLDMLDVLAEADELAKDKRKAAQVFQRAVALKAVVDGVNPKLVAERCGFDPDADDAVRDERMEAVLEQFEAHYGMSVSISGYYQNKDPMDEFKKMLYKAVDDILKEVS